jgi:deazaflavin-dependent oxidoreductase (nitroreductase family)
MSAQPSPLKPMIRFNKYIFNRFARTFAGSTPTFFAIIRHVGRRSGNAYETPIIVEPTQGGFVIALTYGPEVDWYRNIVAANGGTLRWHSRDYVINGIESITAETGLRAFHAILRPILRFRGTQDFVKITTQPSPV